MEKDVLISIRGLQYLMDEESGEQEPVEVMTTGSYYKKNGHHFLIYDEATEGFDMMTHNMIKFTENALEVRKRGLIDVHMIFEEDKKNISFYHTPYGMINMGVAATKVRMKETPDQILLKAEYALDINDSYVGDCVIDIEVRIYKKIPGKNENHSTRVFSRATSQSPGLHETLATAAKAKRNTQSVFLFVSDEILFLLAACLAEHFLPEAVFLFRLL